MNVSLINMLDPSFPYATDEFGYETTTVDLLVAAVALTINHPDDQYAVSPEYLAHLELPQAPGGYDRAAVDQWLDDVIVLLEEA